MKLDSKNVTEVLKDCLFREEEDKSNYVLGEGVFKKFGFHPERLESHRHNIESMINELPDGFKKSNGGGQSFLNAYLTATGVHWGEHQNIDELLCLGIAIKKIEFCMPRDMWNALSGGMPYFVIN